MQINSFEQYQKVYEQSIQNPEQFWDEVAKNFTWMQPYTKVLEWNFLEPNVKWFVNAKLNITQNCLDRHLISNPNKIALIWEPNNLNQPSIKLSYKELHEKVCCMANVLKNNGITKGDRVCFYMPMIPELAISVLACARIGAIHSIVFAGFSAEALADRINDANAKLIITADAINRGNKQLPAKTVVEEALKKCTSVKTVLIANCCNIDIKLNPNTDKWIHEELKYADKYCPPEPMDSEDMLFILYTSGSTGKPKGVVHTCAGYMVYTAYTFVNVFQCQANDIYWCTADIGWITGHSYVLYGPLLAGATTIMFEGIPTFPNASRFWEIIDKYQVNQFYTAPTAIRSLMAEGLDYVTPYSLQSLKTIGTVGEPINEEAWNWYYNNIGKQQCPIVDTWWQTETGGIMISALAGISPLKPAHAGQPLPGIQPVLLTPEGVEIQENNVKGLLCIKFPWPSILRTTYGDHLRCQQTYFAPFKNYYFTGDGAKRDENGLYRIIGRVDDVINVSGHRIGTAEVENAINFHSQVVESAIVAFPHKIKGQGIYAYVICNQPINNPELIRNEIIDMVTQKIGKIARPDKIQFVNALPKTRSGKIMRRILRKIAEGDTQNLGDTSTLLDPAVVDNIIKNAL